MSACGPLDEQPGEGIETQRGAVVVPLGNDFSKNTPSPFSVGIFVTRQVLSQRIGHGGTGNWISQYIRFPQNATHSGWSLLSMPNATVASTVRPATAWFPDTFSVMYRRDTNPTLPMRILDTQAPPGPEVFPSYACTTVNPPCTLGPPTTLSLAAFNFNDSGGFSRMGDGTLRQSYAPGQAAWGDFPIIPAAPFSVNGGPLLVNRSSAGTAGATTSTDSIWFACGPASPARACEMRRTKSSAPMYFTATFGNAGSVLSDGTRPTAISNYTINGERWVFATVDDVGGVHTVWALKENGSIDATTQQTYMAYGIDTTFMNPWQGTYSTPVPYVRKDGKVAVVYFRTNATTTEVWQSIWNATTQVWTKSKIHDVGVPIPAGNEPVPFQTTGLSPLGDQNNSVFFRLPLGGEMRDTVELIEQPNQKYARTLLPAAFELSNLYVIQGANLMQADEVNADSRTQLGTVDWTGAAPFVTDGVGLGYTVQNGSLYEVSLNDGTRRKLGDEAWAGTTQLAFGWLAGNRAIPRLWAIRAGRLREVDLADGKTTQLAGTWNNAQAMTFLPTSTTAADDLYIVGGDQALYRVNSNNGVSVRLGAVGNWPYTRAMVATNGYLYIADGSDDAHMRVYRVQPWSGVWDAWTGVFSNCQGMAVVKGDPYLMKSRKMHRLAYTSGTNISLFASGTTSWDYTVTGIAGRDL
jgi:hypothetical protein